MIEMTEKSNQSSPSATEVSSSFGRHAIVIGAGMAFRYYVSGDSLLLSDPGAGIIGVQGMKEATTLIHPRQRPRDGCGHLRNVRQYCRLTSHLVFPAMTKAVPAFPHDAQERFTS
jgi:hypothetical protein